jgi:hypothetical protein
MSPAELLADLRARGVVLDPDGGRLRVRAPADAWTAELRERVRAHKAELLALLSAAEDPGPAPRGDFGETPDRPCFACKQVAWRERPPEKSGGLICSVCYPDPSRPTVPWPRLALRDLLAPDVRLVAASLGLELDAEQAAGMLLHECPGIGDLDNVERLRAVRACLLVGAGREPFPDTPAALTEATDQVVSVWRSGDRGGARRLFAATVAPGLGKAIELAIQGDWVVCGVCQHRVDELREAGDGRMVCSGCGSDGGDR